MGVPGLLSAREGRNLGPETGDMGRRRARRGAERRVEAQGALQSPGAAPGGIDRETRTSPAMDRLPAWLALVPGVPAKGWIGLEHHGDPIQFANVHVREL